MNVGCGESPGHYRESRTVCNHSDNGELTSDNALSVS